MRWQSVGDLGPTNFVLPGLSSGVYQITSDHRSSRATVSDEIRLAMFWGTGMGYAEDLVKGAETEAQYTMQPTESAGHPDVSGLECRWQPIESRNGRMVSIIVLARSESEEGRATTYREVLDLLDRIVPDPNAARPVRESGLQLAVAGSALEPEARLRTGKAWSESPLSRTRRMVSNVEVETTDEADCFKVYSNMTQFRSRRQSEENWFVCQRRDVIVSTGDSFQIKERRVVLDSAVLNSSFATFI